MTARDCVLLFIRLTRARPGQRHRGGVALRAPVDDAEGEGVRVDAYYDREQALGALQAGARRLSRRGRRPAPGGERDVERVRAAVVEVARKPRPATSSSAPSVA